MDPLPLNQVLCGDNREILPTLPCDSVDLAVTSPPYWGLRDYGHEDQLGLESHPQLYVDHLVEICREVKRVIKPTGSFWLNLGDSYYGSRGNNSDYPQTKNQRISSGMPSKSLATGFNSNWLQPKQLLGIPWRVATALQEDGWILRNCVIWFKPNHMPESVRDRLTKSYEFFFFFVKSKKYYFDLDAIRIPQQTKGDYADYSGKLELSERSKRPEVLTRDNLGKPNHKNGKNPGDVLTKHEFSVMMIHYIIRLITKTAKTREISGR